jgi:hypothetical protein
VWFDRRSAHTSAHLTAGATARKKAGLFSEHRSAQVSGSLWAMASGQQSATP